MKRFGTRKARRYRSLVVVLGVVVIGVAIAATSAQATPTKKNVNAFVTHANPQTQCGTAVGECFQVQVQNDSSSNVTLGSSNLTAPTGWTINSTTLGSASGHNWTVCPGDGTTCGAGTNVVQLRANSSSDSLAAGQSVTAFADVTVNCTLSGNSALWSQETKQANNFSGQPGNDFVGKNLDLNPLGGFSVSDIANPFDRSVPPGTITWTVTAVDTCGQPKASGAAPGQAAYRGTSPYGPATVSATGLTGAVFNPASGLTWGAQNGVGTVTVTPKASGAGNQLTVTDVATGIQQSSNSFVVVDELCTKQNGKACSVNDGQYQKNNVVTTTLSGANPANNGQFLGLGFDPSFQDGCSAGSHAIGAMMLVYPSADLGAYQVTITYTKAAAGKTPPSGVFICFKSDGPGGWIVLPDCSKTQAAPCISSRSGTAGGGLQFVLSLDPSDPHPIGHG